MNDWKARLTQARIAKGLKKGAFAKAVGVSNPTVTDWEKKFEDGGIKEITGLNLMKVCSVLGIAPGWLLHGTVPEPLGSDVESIESEMLLVSKDEADLLEMYRATDFEGRRLIKIMANSVIKK